MLILALFVLWCIMIAAGGMWMIAALAWVGGGVWMVRRSSSRGLLADSIFVWTWPIHVVRHWAGRE